mgnify:CR=1 FL=1
MNQPSETGPIDRVQWELDIRANLTFRETFMMIRNCDTYCRFYNLDEEESVIAALRWN